MLALKAWLLAGSPPHYVLLLAGYAVCCFILSKIPKVRANETIEAVMNFVNPRVVPIVRQIPGIGTVLAGFLMLWDSPTLVIEAKAAPKGPGATMLLPLAFLPFLFSGCLLKGMPATSTLGQKLSADEIALVRIGADVRSKCGNVVSDLLRTGSTAVAAVGAYADPLADLANAAALLQQGKIDAADLKCIYDTVRADIKALTPAQAARLEQIGAELALADTCTPAPDCDQERPACRELRVSGSVTWPETVR